MNELGDSRTLDLRQERRAIEKALDSAVQRYAQDHAEQCVTAVLLQYSAAHGFVSLHLDTREEYEPGDLAAMTHFGFETIDCENWCELYERADEGLVEVITHTGDRLRFETINDDEAFEAPFGAMLVEVLKSFRANRRFEVLPKAQHCELEVEELEGTFGWPPYEERGRDNLL